MNVDKNNLEDLNKKLKVCEAVIYKAKEDAIDSLVEFIKSTGELEFSITPYYAIDVYGTEIMIDGVWVDGNELGIKSEEHDSLALFDPEAVIRFCRFVYDIMASLK